MLAEPQRRVRNHAVLKMEEIRGRRRPIRHKRKLAFLILNVPAIENQNMKIYGERFGEPLNENHGPAM